jgi:hypothetical protein
VIRTPYPGAWSLDALPTGQWVALYPGSHLQTHWGRVALPPDEPFGVLFLQFSPTKDRFAGLAHSARTPLTLWEYVVGIGWRSSRTAVGHVVYDPHGNLLDTLPAGYQFFNEATQQPVSRIETYGPRHGLSEWVAVGDLLIGQGHDSAFPADNGGVRVWDGSVHRTLDVGRCTDISRHLDGEAVALSYVRAGEGGIVVQTTRAELRALPPVPQRPIIITPPVKEPDPMPDALLAPNEKATVERVIREHPEIDLTTDATRERILDHIVAALGGKPWGRKAEKKNGDDLNTDVIAFLRPDNRFEMYDVIANGEAFWKGPRFGPTVQGTNGWWAPARPVMVDDGDPDDPDVIEIEPDLPTLAELTVAVALLATKVATLEAQHAQLLAALEARTIPPPPAYRVKGQTSRAFGHSHTIDLPVDIELP